MYKSFSFHIFILLALSTVFIYNQGYTHENFPSGNVALGGSTVADVIGELNKMHGGVGHHVHIHGLAYSWDDDKQNGHAKGNYNITLQVSCPKNVFDDDWWEPAFNALTPALLQDSFTDGCHEETDITFDAVKLQDIRGIEYIADATVENQVGIARDFIKKPVNEFNEEAKNDNVPEGPSPGIYLADQTPQPGDSATLNLVTSEPYYWVDWYVKAPWESGDRGTYQEGTSGDGTSTTASFSYTFPSGSMHTGDFLITAVIHRYSDMSTYEETHTVTVVMPTTVPDRPGSFELTPHKYAIRLQWTDSASDGGSPITDYQYQYQSSRYGRKNWSSWSDWTSAGTGNSTWINGLSSGVDYAIRMRAVNDIGNSSKTGIKIVKTTQ